jgi:voltage-gated potassium channel
LRAESTRDQAEPSYVTPRLAAWRRRTDGPLLIIAIASLPLLLVELNQADLARADQAFIYAVNVFVLVAFAVDYAVELVLASDRRAYVRREWTSAVIVIAQALALLPSLAAFGFLRFARVIRPLIVIGRVLAIGGAAVKEGRGILFRHATRFALGLAFFTWIASASAFTLVEDVGKHGRIHSIGDSLWWSLCTMTTVGYGEIYPVTFAGRVVGGITMIVGMSVFAIVTAKFAEVLVRMNRQAGEQDQAGKPALEAPAASSHIGE